MHTPEHLARKLKLVFTTPEYFEHALTHRSAAAQNNERLEFLGDAVLGFVIAEALYQQFPEADEGALSRLRASLVNQSSLANLARKIELGGYLILGSGELKSGGFRRDSILSDAFEAIIGAILLDQGIEACRVWILAQFDDLLQNLSPSARNKDPKTRLQELMQASSLDLPVYDLEATEGLPHQQQFSVLCSVQSLARAERGTGSSRKRAEQEAAQKILNRLLSADDDE